MNKKYENMEFMYTTIVEGGNIESVVKIDGEEKIIKGGKVEKEVLDSILNQKPINYSMGCVVKGHGMNLTTVFDENGKEMDYESIARELVHLREELECIDRYFDDKGVPTHMPCDGDGYRGELRGLSRVGRIKSLMEG